MHDYFKPKDVQIFPQRYRRFLIKGYEIQSSFKEFTAFQHFDFGFVQVN